MTLSPATRVRNWRDRKRKAGLVHLDKWVPADKLQDILDAIDKITEDAKMDSVFIQRLLEAGSEQTEIIHRAQAILTQYLIPDGIDGPEAISQLLGLLDGPDQRAAENAWRDAVFVSRDHGRD